MESSNTIFEHHFAFWESRLKQRKLELKKGSALQNMSHVADGAHGKQSSSWPQMLLQSASDGQFSQSL